MDIFALIGSFGGGIIGAYIGAVPIFIFAALLAIVGAVSAMSGGGSFILDYVAFGSYLGPHIAFAGGVAAAAYAGKKKKNQKWFGSVRATVWNWVRQKRNEKNN